MYRWSVTLSAIMLKKASFITAGVSVAAFYHPKDSVWGGSGVHLGCVPYIFWKVSKHIPWEGKSLSYPEFVKRMCSLNPPLEKVMKFIQFNISVIYICLKAMLYLKHLLINHLIISSYLGYSLHVTRNLKNGNKHEKKEISSASPLQNNYSFRSLTLPCVKDYASHTS